MHWRTFDHSPPLILAHRGASGVRPEHTLEGYALALEQGADVIEPDLVPSADGVLYARHDAGMARSTDIAKRAEFRDKQRHGDWRSDSLSASEMDMLRAIQPAQGRPAEFDGNFAVPRWQSVLEWAARAARDRNARVILYPELKCPAEFITRGVDPVQCFIESMANSVLGVEVWVQCFEAEPLRRVHEVTGLPCGLAIDAGADWSACIRKHGAWLSRLVVNKKLLHRLGGVESGLVDAAHAAGLRVDAWTFRDDRIGSGYASVQDELRDALKTGVDGLFCDFPATALAVRDQIP